MVENGIGRRNILFMNMLNENTVWKDANKAKEYAKNTEKNRNKKAYNTPKILLAAMQYTHNYIQGIKRQNAFDASNILMCDINWIRHGTRVEFIDDEGNKPEVKIGTIYYIDYGNNFYGELSYFHHGLCIGKSNGKILVVPMRSGADIIDISYHPNKNPDGQKYYRKALQSEGFMKDCVLLINNTRYISPGRIDKEIGAVSEDVLEEIKLQVFQVQFPDLFQKYTDTQQSIINYEEELNIKKQKIFELHKKHNWLYQKYNKLKEQTIDKNIKK